MDLDNELPRLCELLGVPHRPEVLASIPRNINDRKRYVKDEPLWGVTWEELDALSPETSVQVKNLAREYGY